MICVRLPLLLALFAALGPVSRADSQGCLDGHGKQTRLFNGISVTVSPNLGADQKASGDECALQVKDPQGKIVLAASDHALQILPVSGGDINGDGKSEAVIEGWSGGMHCCFTYWIVAVQGNARLLRKIYNESPIEFEYSRALEKVVLHTEDGRFDYFDRMCHACSPIPQVYMTLQGEGLVDVSPEFWPQYQQEIIGARERLTQKNVEAFREHFSHQSASENPYMEERAAVLTIVLAYLNSGKPEDAWSALHELWPPTDENRIRELIEKTRGQGLAKRKSEDENTGAS